MDILRRLAVSRYTLGIAGGLVPVGGAAYLATRDTYFIDFSPRNDDSLFGSHLYQQINPNANTTLHDLCVRRVPTSHIRDDLIEDARNGGSKLVEEFCKGMWSGRIFAPQRTAMQVFAERGRLQKELWTKHEIRSNPITAGTRIGGEFEVITVAPNSIILRGGQPKKHALPVDDKQADLRDVDVLGELAVKIDPERDTVDFQFKGIFFCGTGVGSKPPLPEFLDPLRRAYASALLREGSQWCLK